MEEFNRPLQQLGTDIGKAINDYMKDGNVNLAAIIGVLEDMKFNVMDMMRKLTPAERIVFKKPPEYIG